MRRLLKHRRPSSLRWFVVRRRLKLRLRRWWSESQRSPWSAGSGRSSASGGGGGGGGGRFLSEGSPAIAGGDASRAHLHVWSPVQDALSSGQALPGVLDRELCHAVTRGDVASTKQLLQYGADKDARNGAGAPSVWLAAANGHAAVLSELAVMGANLHVRDPSGHTALTVACVNGHAKCVSLLLWHGADCEALTKGFTPLMYAAWQGWANCAELLLRAGASPARENSEGQTALDLALQHKNAEVARLLGAGTSGGGAGLGRSTSGESARGGGGGAGAILATGYGSPTRRVTALVEEGVPPPSPRWYAR